MKRINDKLIENPGYSMADLKKMVDDIIAKLSKMDKPKEYQIGGEYWGRAELLKNRSNVLEIVDHFTWHGGYYIGNIDYDDCYVAKVGGAYPYEAWEEERNALRKAFNYHNDMSDSFEVGGKIAFMIWQYGTNYSYCGVGFKPVPAKQANDASMC